MNHHMTKYFLAGLILGVTGSSNAQHGVLHHKKAIPAKPTSVPPIKATRTYSLYEHKSLKGSPISFGRLPPGGSHWMTPTWKGNNQPFLSIQKRIDQLAQQKKLGRADILKYKKFAAENPNDPLRQFRFAYATFRTVWYSSTNGIVFTRTDRERLYGEAAWALAEAKNPDAYSYTRLRFLVTAAFDSNITYRLKPISLRLLRRHSHDYEVKFYVVRILSSSLRESERRQALTYAHQMVRQRPNSSGAHSTVAYVYFDDWSRGQSAAGPKAVAAYSKALKLSRDIPANAEARRNMHELIQLISQTEAKKR